MNSRISCKTVIAPLLASAMLAMCPLSGADAPLRSRIDYHFVGHQEQTDDAGRVLVWEANVDGDLNGTLKWWFVSPPPVPEVAYSGGRISYYAARWELWQNGELALAGESSGKTDFRDNMDGLWDGHGRVTEGNGEYESLTGRGMYESGPVLLGTEPPITFAGTGVFVVY